MFRAISSCGIRACRSEHQMSGTFTCRGLRGHRQRKLRFSQARRARCTGSAEFGFYRTFGKTQRTYEAGIRKPVFPVSNTSSEPTRGLTACGESRILRYKTDEIDRRQSLHGPVILLFTEEPAGSECGTRSGTGACAQHELQTTNPPRSRPECGSLKTAPSVARGRPRPALSSTRTATLTDHRVAGFPCDSGRRAITSDQGTHQRDCSGPLLPADGKPRPSPNRTVH